MAKTKPKYKYDDVVKIKGDDRLWLILEPRENNQYEIRSYDISWYSKDLELNKRTPLTLSEQKSEYKTVDETDITNRVHLDKNFIEIQVGDTVVYLSKTGMYSCSALVGEVVDLSNSRVKLDTNKYGYYLAKPNNLVVCKILPKREEM